MKKAAAALSAGNNKECCDDAYSAIEALLKNITDEDKNDFKKLVNQLEIYNGLKEAIKNGWRFASNRARHGQNESKYIYPNDKEARFVLVFSSAVINLILDLVKINK